MIDPSAILSVSPSVACLAAILLYWRLGVLAAALLILGPLGLASLGALFLSVLRDAPPLHVVHLIAGPAAVILIAVAPVAGRRERRRTR